MIGAVANAPTTSSAEALLRSIARGAPTNIRLQGRSGLVIGHGPAPCQLLESGRRATIGRPFAPSLAEARPSSLRGDFASIDLAGEEALLLARGRFGGRALYYGKHKETGALLASSELEPLVHQLGGVSIDLERIAGTSIRATPQDHGRTHYREIRRVPPACVLRIDEHTDRIEDIFAVEALPTREGHVADLADELREILRSAVERAMDGFDKVGVFVSGGIDSSVLLAIACAVGRASGRRVEAYNVCFPARGDDRTYLDSICDYLGVLPTRLSPHECARFSRDAWVLDAAPAGWMGLAWELAFSKIACDNGVTLILSGVGGDEVTGGDVRIFGERARQGDVLGALRGAIRLAGFGSSTAWSRVNRLVLRALIRTLLPVEAVRRIRKARRSIPIWAGARLRSLIDADALESYSEAFVPSEGPAERSIVAALARASGYLAISDGRGQLETATQCARAEPYLDDRLTEFMASIRPDLLLNGNWFRGLFRQAIRGWVPEAVRLRTNKGFLEEAFAEIVTEWGGFETLQELASARKLASYELVQPAPFMERFEALRRNPLSGPLWLEVWPVIVAEAFLCRVGVA